MKTAIWFPAAVALVLCASVLVAPSVAASPRGGGAPKTGERADVFCVVQLGDDFQVVRKPDLKSFKDRIAAEDKQQAKAYEDAKKAASKSSKSKGKAAGSGDAPPDFQHNQGRPVDLTQPPVKRKVTVLKECKSEQEAQELVSKYREEGVDIKPAKKPAAP